MKSIPILAVDGGGTCSRAALCDDRGQLLAYGEDGPVNYQNIGIEQTRTNLTRLFQSLLGQINESSLTIERAVLGMAGIDTSLDYQIVNELVQEVFSNINLDVKQLFLENDANMTLLGMADGGAGVLVIAGTGSICCGINRDGKMTRVGGWGHRIGDEGSGYWISQAAIQHIFRAEDGQEAPSGITSAVLSHLKLASISELLSWVYAADCSIDDIASLAPVIFQLADEGDKKANEILSQAAADLADACRTAIEKLGLSGQIFSLILGGGILQHHGFVSGLLIKQLAEHYKFNANVLNQQPLFCALRYGLRKGKGISNGIEAGCAQLLHEKQLQWKTG